jgi:2-dehydropantoate 2-reductase
MEECRAIAAEAGYTLRPAALARVQGLLTLAGSPLTASMLRDLERGAALEADHVLGDLLHRRVTPPVGPSLLQTAVVRLKVYEARRQAKQA